MRSFVVRALVTVLVASLPATQELWPQELDWLHGARVRVSANMIDTAASPPFRVSSHSVNVTGTLLDSTGDSLWVQHDDSSGVTVLPRTAVTRFERHDGRKHNARKGAVIGALVGGLSLVFGYSGPTEETGCPVYTEFTCSEPAPDRLAATALMGAGVGMLVGAAIGAAVSSDSWKPVEPARVAAGPALVRGAPGLAMRISF